MVQELFAHYAKKARLPKDKRRPHVLKHAIAVHMLDAGHHLEEVQHQLGHKSITSTQIYAVISGRKQKEIFQKMERSREIVHFS